MERSFTLLHRTVYRYDRAVKLGPQLLRLRPRPDPRAAEPGYRLSLEPEPASLHWLLDPLGNQVARLGFAGALDRLAITVRLELDLQPRNPFDFLLERSAVQWPFRYDPLDAAVLDPFLRIAGSPASAAALAAFDPPAPGTETVGLVLGLAAAVRDRVAYVVREEPGVWSPERTLAEARGSCRDTAWLLVQLLRHHGIAARFVSGYLLQLGEAGAEPPGQAELHAWAELFLPGAGWIGIDSTSGLLASESHVALVAAAEPDGAAPLQGTVEPAEVTMETSTVLQRLAA